MKIFNFAIGLPPKRVKLLLYFGSTYIMYQVVEYFGEIERKKFMKKFRSKISIQAKENAEMFISFVPFIFDAQNREKPFDFDALGTGANIYLLSCDFKDFAPILSTIQENNIKRNFRILFLTDKEGMLSNSGAISFLKEANVDVAFVSQEGSQYFRDKFIVLNEEMEYMNETDLTLFNKKGPEAIKSAVKGGIMRARDEKFTDFFRKSSPNSK